MHLYSSFIRQELKRRQPSNIYEYTQFLYAIWRARTLRVENVRYVNNTYAQARTTLQEYILLLRKHITCVSPHIRISKLRTSNIKSSKTSRAIRKNETTRNKMKVNLMRKSSFVRGASFHRHGSTHCAKALRNISRM